MDQRGHFHIGGTAQWNVPKTQRRGEVTPQPMKPYLAIDLSVTPQPLKTYLAIDLAVTPQPLKPYLAIDLALGRPNSLWPPNCLCLKSLSLEFI